MIVLISFASPQRSGKRKRSLSLPSLMSSERLLRPSRVDENAAHKGELDEEIQERGIEIINTRPEGHQHGRGTSGIFQNPQRRFT